MTQLIGYHPLKQPINPARKLSKYSTHASLKTIQSINVIFEHPVDTTPPIQLISGTGIVDWIC